MCYIKEIYNLSTFSLSLPSSQSVIYCLNFTDKTGDSFSGSFIWHQCHWNVCSDISDLFMSLTVHTHTHTLRAPGCHGNRMIMSYDWSASLWHSYKSHATETQPQPTWVTTVLLSVVKFFSGGVNCCESPLFKMWCLSIRGVTVQFPGWSVQNSSSHLYRNTCSRRYILNSWFVRPCEMLLQVFTSPTSPTVSNWFHFLHLLSLTSVVVVLPSWGFCIWLLQLSCEFCSIVVALVVLRKLLALNCYVAHNIHNIFRHEKVVEVTRYTKHNSLNN